MRGGPRLAPYTHRHISDADTVTKARERAVRAVARNHMDEFMEEMRKQGWEYIEPDLFTPVRTGRNQRWVRV